MEWKSCINPWDLKFFYMYFYFESTERSLKKNLNPWAWVIDVLFNKKGKNLKFLWVIQEMREDALG